MCSSLQKKHTVSSNKSNQTYFSGDASKPGTFKIYHCLGHNCHTEGQITPECKRKEKEIHSPVISDLCGNTGFNQILIAFGEGCYYVYPYSNEITNVLKSQRHPPP